MIRTISRLVVKKSTIMETSTISSSIDSDDNKQSIDERSRLDIYEKAEAYWASVSSNVDGMLGGFADLHGPDIADSRTLLRTLIGRGKMSTNRAIDCGCGIGRITKHLLLPVFDKVDMVDVTESFIDKSTTYIGDRIGAKVGEKYVIGLQDFEPQSKHYDIIWIQWVSGHLTDEHLVRFLRRCKIGLRPNGFIVLKENVSSSGTTDFDVEDNSYTRSRSLIVDLIAQSDLEIVYDRKQTNFPKGMYEVRMFALR